MNNEIKLKPWVGENYNNGNRFGKKILVIGESKHGAGNAYDNENLNPDIQIEDLQDHIENEYRIRFYDRIGKLFNSENSREIWSEIAFTNLIHTIFTKGDDQPKIEQIQNVESFWLYLEELKPDKVIICSNRMWNVWFSAYIDNESVELIPNSNIGLTNVFIYPYSGGTCQAIGINHPSTRVSDSEYQNRWQPEIEKFLAF